MPYTFDCFSEFLYSALNFTGCKRFVFCEYSHARPHQWSPIVGGTSTHKDSQQIFWSRFIICRRDHFLVFPKRHPLCPIPSLLLIPTHRIASSKIMTVSLKRFMTSSLEALQKKSKEHSPEWNLSSCTAASLVQQPQRNESMAPPRKGSWDVVPRDDGTKEEVDLESMIQCTTSFFWWPEMCLFSFSAKAWCRWGHESVSYAHPLVCNTMQCIPTDLVSSGMRWWQHVYVHSVDQASGSYEIESGIAECILAPQPTVREWSSSPPVSVWQLQTNMLLWGLLPSQQEVPLF